MGVLLNFVIIAIQFTSTLATESIPLKCFLQDYNFLNIFGGKSSLSSSYNAPTLRLPRFGIVRVSSAGFNKDGWRHDANNLEYHGLDDAVLDDFGFNLNTKVSHITFHTDMYITYNYKTNGTLYSLPIYGEGFAEVPLRNIQIGMNMPFDIKEVNGNKFIELRNFNYWFNIKDHAELKFSNLYCGNEELSDSMHRRLNQNWRFLIPYFGHVFYDKLAEEIFEVFKNSMLAVPLKDFATC